MSDYDGSADDRSIEQLESDLEAARNGCEQALLLLERARFTDDPEAGVVRAVLRCVLQRDYLDDVEAKPPPDLSESLE